MEPVLSYPFSVFWRFFHFLLPHSTLISNQAALGPDAFHSPSLTKHQPGPSLSISSCSYKKRNTLRVTALYNLESTFVSSLSFHPPNKPQLKMITLFYK